MMRGTASIALICLLQLAGSFAWTGVERSAWADEPRLMAEFRRHYQEGTAAFRQGRFTTALIELKAAYDLKQLPRLLFNLGQAHLQLGHSKEAIRHYELFLKLDSSISAAERQEIERLIQVARSLDQETRAAQAPLPERPGPGIAASAEADRDQGGASTAGAVAPSQPVVLAPSPPPPAAPAVPTLSAAASARAMETHAPSWRRRAAIGGSISAVLAAAAITTGTLALLQGNTLTGTVWADPQSYQVQQSRLRGLTISTDVLIGAAVVSLGGTLLSILVQRRAAPRRAITGKEQL